MLLFFVPTIITFLYLSAIDYFLHLDYFTCAAVLRLYINVKLTIACVLPDLLIPMNPINACNLNSSWGKYACLNFFAFMGPFLNPPGISNSVTFRFFVLISYLLLLLFYLVPRVFSTVR